MIGIVALLGLALALALVWGLGYILIAVLAPGVFAPRAHQAAVALLLGVCVAGIALLLPGALLHNAAWFDRAVYWMVPALIAAGALVLLVRERRRLALPRLGASRSWPAVGTVGTVGAVRPARALRALLPWASAALLLVAATALVAHHPATPATIEMYGTRAGDRVQVSVTSLPSPRDFVLVVTSGRARQAAAVPLRPLGAHGATATVTLRGATRIALYRVAGNPAARRPLRLYGVFVAYSRREIAQNLAKTPPLRQLVYPAAGGAP